MASIQPRTVMLWPDTHFPYHDPLAVACAKEIARHVQPEEVLFGGDIANCGAFKGHKRSSIDDDGAESFYETELWPIVEIAEFLVNECGVKKITFISGNHEHWVTIWCAENRMAAVHDLIHPEYVLRDHVSPMCEFQWIPYMPMAGVDNVCSYEIFPHRAKTESTGLIAVHGWSAAKYAATVHMEMAKPDSICFFHTHRIQEDNTNETRGRRRLIKAWSVGCLSQMTPDYARSGSPTKWTHGVGFVFVGKQGWREDSVNINNGYCVLERGVEIKVA